MSTTLNRILRRATLRPVIILGLFCLLGFVPHARAEWEKEWAQVVAAAEKEGEITLYGQARSGVAKAIQAFSEHYPRIKLNFVGGSGSNLAKKIMAEERAGKHLADVAVGGGGTMVLVYHKAGLLQPIDSALILPEVRDQTQWWSGKHLYADPDGRHVFMAQGDAGSGIGAINTQLVKAGEINLWWDLLTPRWKGKIVMTDPKSAGNIGSWRFIYYDEDLGSKFIRRLIAEGDVLFAADERQMMDWVGAGKYQIHVLAKVENTENARKQGLPVQQVFSEKEGDTISTGSGHVSFFKNAPHPNAAKVYVNWFLSRAAQTGWQKYTGRNSFRNDIPKDDLPFKDLQVPKEGRRYLLTSLPKYRDVKPLRRLVDELMAEGKR